MPSPDLGLPDLGLADWQGDKRSSTPFHPVFVHIPPTPRSPKPRLTPVSTASGHLAATSSSNPIVSSSSGPVASFSLNPQSEPTRLHRRLVIDLTRDEDDDHQGLRPRRRGEGLIIDLTDDEPQDVPGFSTTIIDLTGDDFEDGERNLEVEILPMGGLNDLDIVIEDHAITPVVGDLYDRDLDELECDDDDEYMGWSVLEGSSRTDDHNVRLAQQDGLGLGTHPDLSNRPPISTGASRTGQSHLTLSGSRNDALDLSEGLHRLSMDASWVKRRWRGQTVYDLSEEGHLHDDLGGGIAPEKRRKL
jgi:hypothetical protein